MGMLVEGEWTDKWHDTASSGGRFVRPTPRFRNFVTADGRPGPTGEGGFPAERDRYHLYVALACPWAHRALIFRRLKRLEDMISISIVAPVYDDKGWYFGEGAHADTANGKARLSDIYLMADPRFTGRVTVPVLWDKARRAIVNNESSEIIRMFNTAFAALAPATSDYYPAELAAEIDAINAVVFETVNNGVYRTGFATTQAAYEEAFGALFETLDALESRLSRQRYLVGNRITEADWRLFTTLVRFDPVYFGHFKCNLRRIKDYPNLWNYLLDLHQVEGIAGTVDMDEIKTHYYASHKHINPTGIVPLGPEMDLAAPHDRGRFG